jgi:hypothetical protein
MYHRKSCLNTIWIDNSSSTKNVLSFYKNKIEKEERRKKKEKRKFIILNIS